MNLLAVSAVILATTYYVAPNGSDENDGLSKTKPVATVAQAVDLARQQMKDEPKVISVADGFYYFDQAVRMGGDDVDVTIKAEHKGKATFSGAMPIKGWRTDSKDKRFLVADFPFEAQPNWLYMLVVGGKMADFSAFPQFGGLRKLPYIANSEDAAKGNHTVIKYDRRSLPAMDCYKDLDLTSAWMIIPQEWASTRTYIATNDWENGTFVLRRRTNMPIGRFNQGYQIMNSRMGMTHPGCWMFEATAKKIYYWPKEGETAKNLDATVSHTQCLFEISNTRNVKFSGLVMEGCAAPFNAGIYSRAGLAAVIAGYSMSKAVIEDCEIRNTAGSGIRFCKPNRCVTRRCYVHHCGSHCIDYVDGGDASDIYDSEVCYNGYFATSACAIGLQISNVKCVGNHIHHSPGCGVVMWSRGSLFASNHLHHTMSAVRDGGGVYGAMSYCMFKDNYVHDSGDWPGLYNDEGGQFTTYTGNRFVGDWWPFHMHDCYGIVITNNEIICDSAMRFSFQGSVHSVFKDNVIKTGDPITEDPYLDNCDIWENEVQIKQADGTYKALGKVTLPKTTKPIKDACVAVRTSGPVFNEDGKFNAGAFRTPWHMCAGIDRDAKGFVVSGVPCANARPGFDDEYLYFRGSYEYNKLAGYEGAKSLGHVWGVHDGLRFHFKGFDVTLFMDGTVTSSGASLVFNPTNSFVKFKGGVGMGSYGYAFRIPLKKLGIDGKTAEGKEIPFNITFYNADHREYKYYVQPENPGLFGRLVGSAGEILAGKLTFKPYVQDNYSFVNTKIGTAAGGNTFPGAVWPCGMIQPGPDTCDREGDDYGSSCSGYDANHEQLMGFTQTHLSGTSRPDLQDFLLLPFTGPDPKGDARPVQHVEKASETAQPGYYSIRLERWAMSTEMTASKRCAYHRFGYDRGGTVKVFLDTQAGPFASWRKDAPKNRVTFSESTFGTNGVLEGHNRVTCWKDDRDIYAKIAFDPRPITIRELPDNGKPGKRYIAEFKLKPKGAIVAKVAISGVDMEGARKNFDSDPEGFDFDARKKECVQAWRNILTRVMAKGDSPKLQNFYTAIYRTMVQPNIVSDAGGHDVYTSFSAGDAFRMTHPWYKIFAPNVVNDFVKSSGPTGACHCAFDVMQTPAGFVDRPDKTAEIVRDLCDKHFEPKSGGLCGNDDGGQISAWYVFACLGFYPINPVGGEYVIGAPQLSEVAIKLENGKTFKIIAKDLSTDNKYVKSVMFNGKPLNSFILKQSDIMAGGELVFEMTAGPGR